VAPLGLVTQTESTEGVNVVTSTAPRTLRLAAGQRRAVTMPLAAPAAGSAAVIVRVSGPSGFALERSYAVAVKPAFQVLARRTVKPLARGESLTLSSDLFAELHQIGAKPLIGFDIIDWPIGIVS
jgi:alpha-2-macroglobulin